MKIVRDFEVLKGASDEFVSWDNEKLDEKSSCELEGQSALPEIRVRRKKIRPVVTFRS